MLASFKTKEHWQHDVVLGRQQEAISGTMSGYGFASSGTTYDFEDRLTAHARTSSTFSQSWSLTSVGDWSSVTTNGTAQSRTHGNTHELLTAGGSNVTTDVKGSITVLPSNLVAQSSALGLVYDFDNKMKSADVGNDSSVDVEYKYDALGRRVGRSGSSGSFAYVQSDQQTLMDYGLGDAPNSPLYRYVYGSYIDEPAVRKGSGSGGTLYYFHRNQQYSVYCVTSSSAAITERYAYTAYGEPTICNSSGTVIGSSSISNRYAYTGREWDGTVGLYHFRARWMSGLTGRFLTRDPMRYISGWNMNSSYMGLKKLDPRGMFPDDPKPPFPNAVGPDEKGCFSMKLQDFIDMITSGQDVAPLYVKALGYGCVGITTCAQAGGTCTAPRPFPEYLPRTTCAKAQKATDPIPDSILKAKCKENEEPFIFAKQGVDGGPKSWRLGPDNCYNAPKGVAPTNDSNPPVVPNDGAGGFNYIWYVNGWYVWVNHGLDVPGDAVVSICGKPLDSDDYPLTMWCVSCKKKCAESMYPVFPVPPTGPPVPSTAPER